MIKVEMMKKLFLMAGLVLLIAACSTDENEEVKVEKPIENPVEATAPVTVQVNDFSVTMTDFTNAPAMTRSAVDAANFADVKCVTLAIYAGDEEVYKATQIKGDGTYTTFGVFSFNIPIGTYTLVAIGRNYWTGDEFVLNSPSSAGYTSERPRETFCHTQSVTVTSTTPLSLNVTLSRIIAQLYIQSTDGRSAGVTKIRTTYAAGSKSFNPTTGLALDDNGFSQTNTPSQAVNSPINIYSNVFLTTDEQTMGITIEALDASNNVLFTKVVTAVPLQRNRKTTLSGAIFTAGSSSTGIKLETDWIDGDGNTVTF